MLGTANGHGKDSQPAVTYRVLIPAEINGMIRLPFLKFRVHLVGLQAGNVRG